ncbi:MAG: cytochrome c [Gammaproteobacteria bacterium]|nr:MAG: cytochrome c [Gammaproteobacteria bacterium]
MKKFATAAALTLTCTLAQASDYTPAAGIPAAQIFSEACASCHGDAGSGKFGFLLKLTETTLSKEQIINRIWAGGTLMPEYPNIKSDQLAKLADYIKALSAE